MEQSILKLLLIPRVQYYNALIPKELKHLKGLVEKEQKKIQLGSVKKVSLSDLEEQRYNFKPPFRELDVRSLEMPMPMVTILRELEDLPEGEALFVHHKKVPQFLLPELEAKGMSVLISELGQDNVKLLIHR